MVKNIWTKKHKPLFLLAPMAGYTDSAFRQLCREYGADLVMTELVSADAIAYGKFKIQNLKAKNIVTGKNHNTAEMLSFSEEERPLVVQLFGKYPEKFALAAKWITEELKPDGIDINMGCPARKVVGSDHGAALLKNPDLAVEIVEAVKGNTNLPVSVKTRLGWHNDDQILEFAPKLAAAGVQAIIIHGRTYVDGFKGKARWENIYNVKKIIQNTEFGGTAVIGNGDIQSYQEAMERAEGGVIMLDGVAIGRATFGKPYLFNPKLSSSNLGGGDLKKLIKRHAELVWQNKGEHGIIEFRKHLLAYLKGFVGARELRVEAVSIQSFADVENILLKLHNK